MNRVDDPPPHIQDRNHGQGCPELENDVDHGDQESRAGSGETDSLFDSVETGPYHHFYTYHGLLKDVAKGLQRAGSAMGSVSETCFVPTVPSLVFLVNYSRDLDGGYHAAETGNGSVMENENASASAQESGTVSESVVLAFHDLSVAAEVVAAEAVQRNSDAKIPGQEVTRFAYYHILHPSSATVIVAELGAYAEIHDRKATTPFASPNLLPPSVAGASATENDHSTADQENVPSEAGWPLNEHQVNMDHDERGKHCAKPNED